jgi:F-type H+-transporting ATPase subunit b
MQIISNIALISINETVFIQLISFLIFLFLINRIMFRPLQDVMQQRDTHIDTITKGIKDSKTQLTDLDKQLREKEKTAIKEANLHRDTLEDDGVRNANEILDVSKTEILKIKEESQQYIDAQISEARKTLTKESEKLAKDIMEKVLNRGLAHD